jgi:hypothetical protein
VLKDENGEEVALKEGAKVDVTKQTRKTLSKRTNSFTPA